MLVTMTIKFDKVYLTKATSKALCHYEKHLNMKTA